MFYYSLIFFPVSIQSFVFVCKEFKGATKKSDILSDSYDYDVFHWGTMFNSGKISFLTSDI